MESTSDATMRGFEAGQAYRREHPENLKQIFEGYGYTTIEADGWWKAGFEVSDFRSKKSPQESWWLTVIANEGDAQKVRVEARQEGVQVHVSGYLSPPGYYGHLGQSRRELFATSVTPEKK
jgi:hypothetical protein